MKSLRQVCAALVLTFALLGSAFAGDMNSTPTTAAPGDISDPPAAAHGDMPTPPAPGDVGTPGFAIFLDVLSVIF